MKLEVRSRSLQADVHGELSPGVDRAGNATARLLVTLLPGTHVANREGRRVLLDEPAPLVVTLYPDVLARLCERAQTNKSGRATWGPLTVQRTLKAPKVRTEEP